MVIWNSNGTSVLLFKTVSYQTHGVYKCIAQNEVGQARKMFRIFVEGMRAILRNPTIAANINYYRKALFNVLTQVWQYLVNLTNNVEIHG